jgi:hypothetical protein
MGKNKKEIAHMRTKSGKYTKKSINSATRLQNSREKARSVRGGMKAATGNGSGKERE